MALPVTVLSAVAAAGAAAFDVTLRSQWMGGTHLGGYGRQEWVANTTKVRWAPENTALVVVDMWNQHWCPSATTRVAEVAVPMQETIAAARAGGATVIWAPSDVTAYYAGTAARMNTLSLPNMTVPRPRKQTIPPLPLGTGTDGGCDVVATQRDAWTHQIDTLKIDPRDFLITSTDGPAEQELWNILSARKVSNLLYMGVHENMCILGRPFAIEKVVSWGWQKDHIAVVRELVDVMYTPRDPPYVSHDEGLRIHTAYVEKFWASSVSMYDILAPTYAGAVHARPRA